jgi:hypothetical protein
VCLRHIKIISEKTLQQVGSKYTEGFITTKNQLKLEKSSWLIRNSLNSSIMIEWKSALLTA